MSGALYIQGAYINSCVRLGFILGHYRVHTMNLMDLNPLKGTPSRRPFEGTPFWHAFEGTLEGTLLKEPWRVSGTVNFQPENSETLPIVSIVVPFWGYRFGSLI